MFFPVPGDSYRNNVLLHLPMTGENNSTTFTDVSVFQRAITLDGSPIISITQSKWGAGSGYFDGSSSLSVPYNSVFDFGSNDLTMEAWIYIVGNSSPDADGGRGAAILSSWSSASAISGFLFSIGGSTTTTGTSLRLDTWFSGNATLYICTCSVSKTSWHHIAVTVQSGTRRVFLDGTQISGSIVTVGSGYTNVDAFNNLHVGATLNSGYPIKFYGYIQDVRITTGIARYITDFSIPDAPFTCSGRSLVSPVGESSLLNIAKLGL